MELGSVGRVIFHKLLAQQMVLLLLGPQHPPLDPLQSHFPRNCSQENVSRAEFRYHFFSEIINNIPKY